MSFVVRGFAKVAQVRQDDEECPHVSNRSLYEWPDLLMSDPTVEGMEVAIRC